MGLVMQYEEMIELSRSAMGPERTRALMAEGEAMSEDEAIAYALGRSG
jgi:hypothetical protein